MLTINSAANFLFSNTKISFSEKMDLSPRSFRLSFYDGEGLTGEKLTDLWPNFYSLLMTASNNIL